MPDEPDAEGGPDAVSPDLPGDVAEEAARLTRLALEADDRHALTGPYQETTDTDQRPAEDPTTRDEAALYRRRRDELLESFGYVARVREDRDGGSILVCHPAEWLDEDGVVRLDSDLDTSRAVELPLSGPGEQGDYESAAAANDELVAAVADEHGDVHAANARAFANFMSNYYARPMDSASAAEVREFLEDYYPRNAWPSEEAAAVVEESLRYVFAVAEERYPLD